MNENDNMLGHLPRLFEDASHKILGNRTHRRRIPTIMSQWFLIFLLALALYYFMWWPLGGYKFTKRFPFLRELKDDEPIVRKSITRTLLIGGLVFVILLLILTLYSA